jgi:hypothetical protein
MVLRGLGVARASSRAKFFQGCRQLNRCLELLIKRCNSVSFDGKKIKFLCLFLRQSLKKVVKQSTGGPRYIRSFYLRNRVSAIGNTPFFWNVSLQITIITRSLNMQIHCQ